MKKKILVIISIVIVGGLVASGVLFYNKWRTSQANSWEDPFVKLFVDNYPTDILVLGEEFNLHDDLYVRYSKEITPEVLKTKDGCVRQVIILYNDGGTVDYPLEDLYLIRDKIDALECDFFCVGKSMDEKLVEAGILWAVQADDTYVPSINIAWGQKNLCNGLHSSSKPTLEEIKTMILYDMKSNLRDAIS